MRVFVRGILTVTSAALLCVTAPAAGQGFVIVTADSSARITIGGRVQTIFNTTSVDDEPATQTELRRVRLETNFQYGSLIFGRIQPEFAGSRVTLKDAYVRLAFDPALQLWAGQAHRPFGIISPGSSVRMAPIERGLRIRGVQDGFDEYNLIAGLGYSDRDMGLQLRGEPRNGPLGVSYAVGFFNGPARTTAPEDNTWQAVARLAVHPLPSVRVGASWSRIDHVLEETTDETIDTREGQAWGADVELGTDRGGFHLVGEAAYGDFDPFVDARFFGAQGWVAYRTGRMSGNVAAVEPFVRVSHGNPDVDDEELVDPATGGTLFTPGVNLWLGGLNRLALNYEVWHPEDGGNVHAFKAMFQIAF
jgi:hypothetical protein